MTNDFSDIRGLASTAREFAHAVNQRARGVEQGGILLVARPGAGATMLARRATGLLTVCDRDMADMAETYGAARMPAPCGVPFRAPHHTVSRRGLVGEMDLARYGVLLLSDVVEFPRQHWVTVGMNEHSFFTLLVVTVAPCPCSRPRCRCTVKQLERWQQRVDEACGDLGITKRIIVPWLTQTERTTGTHCSSTDELREMT